MHRFRRVLPVLLMLILWQIGLPVQAQDNLLKNPNFESPYGGVGTADGWDGGFVTTPHTESWMNIAAIFTAQRAVVYEGSVSQEMTNGGTFTAAVWQKVDNIQAGTRLRFSAWVYVKSEAGANSRVRVGIDSNNIDDTRVRARPVHTKLLAADIPICEHMTGLDQLPAAGARLFAVPVKVRAFGTFPVRAFAIV